MMGNDGDGLAKSHLVSRDSRDSRLLTLSERLDHSSLPMVTHGYPSLPIVTHRYPSLPIVTHRYPLVTHRYPLVTHLSGAQFGASQGAFCPSEPESSQMSLGAQFGGSQGEFAPRYPSLPLVTHRYPLVTPSLPGPSKTT